MPRAGVGLSVTKLQGDEGKAQGRWVDTPWISGLALLTGTLRGSAASTSALQSGRRNGHGLTQQLTNTHTEIHNSTQMQKDILL